MYIVLDLEFYHNTKKEKLGPIKQIGAFKFDKNYQIIDVFEMTVTKYTTHTMLQKLFNTFVQDVTTMYVWAKDNDLKAMKSVLDVDYLNIEVVDVQVYFKEVNLASLSAISEVLSFDSEGRHNALIDAEYTYEIVKHFNFNSEVTRIALSNYVDLIKANESNQKKALSEKNNQVSNNDANDICYKFITPGSMRKLNEDYYQIINERAINEIVTCILNRKLPVSKHGKFTLNQELEQLVANEAPIIFTNVAKFNTVAKKFEDKLIIIIDKSSNKTNYLGVFVSRKIYRKFIK